MFSANIHVHANKCLIYGAIEPSADVTVNIHQRRVNILLWLHLPLSHQVRQIWFCQYRCCLSGCNHILQATFAPLALCQLCWNFAIICKLDNIVLIWRWHEQVTIGTVYVCKPGWNMDGPPSTLNIIFKMTPLQLMTLNWKWYWLSKVKQKWLWKTKLQIS